MPPVSASTALSKVVLRVAVAGAVGLVTTAGACSADPPAALPTPDAADAAPLPAGATAGVSATFARLVREERDGTQCFHLLRFTADGRATSADGCSQQGVAAVVDDARTWADRDVVGDYGVSGARLRVRLVAWDSLAEAVATAVYDASWCGERLDVIALAGTDRQVRAYELVDGAAPDGPSTCER